MPPPGVIHAVKCWPEFFEAILDGRKTFDARVNDRPFQEGDYLLLSEFDPVNYQNGGRGYTGRECKVEITYIGRCLPGLPRHIVVMSIVRTEPPAEL